MDTDRTKTMQTTNVRLILGAVLLIAGFYALASFSWAWWGLFIGGGLAWLIAFQRDSKLAFSRPRKLWLIPVGAIVYLVTATLTGLLASAIGFDWAANPGVGHLNQLIFMLPFMLMGEELLGIGILEGLRSKGLSFLLSSLISALIFGLMHVFSYWDGSVFSTVAHVLLLQGVARLIFNYVYLKMGRSIWGSWLTHLLVDLIALAR